MGHQLSTCHRGFMGLQMKCEHDSVFTAHELMPCLGHGSELHWVDNHIICDTFTSRNNL